MLEGFFNSANLHKTQHLQEAPPPAAARLTCGTFFLHPAPLRLAFRRAERGVLVVGPDALPDPGLLPPAEPAGGAVPGADAPLAPLPPGGGGTVLWTQREDVDR